MSASAFHEAAGAELISAASSGDIPAVRWLLREAPGAARWAHPATGDTALIAASFRGKAGAVEILLGAGEVDVNARDSHGVTALVAAAQQGHLACVKVLVADPRVDAGAATDAGTTALMMACKRDERAMVEVLAGLGRRAAPDLVDGRGCTALDYCSPDTEPFVLMALGKKSAAAVDGVQVDPVVAAAKEAKEAELFGACFEGNTDLVDALLNDVSLDFDINAVQTPHRLSPLAVACHKGFSATVERLLLDPRIDVNARARGGPTPFILACKGGHTKVIELLLRDPRVNVNARTPQGTGFLLACQSGSIPTLQLLLANIELLGIDVEARDSKSKSAIDYIRHDLKPFLQSALDARSHARKTSSELLAQVESMITSPSPPRPTTSHAASPTTRFSIRPKSSLRPNSIAISPTRPKSISVRPVSLFGGPVPSRIPFEKSQLHATEAFVHACSVGDLAVVNIHLAKRRFDPNAANRAGQNGVHAACESDRVEVLARLVKDGRVDFNRADARGRTGLFIAAQMDHLDSVEFLCYFPDRVDASLSAPTGLLKIPRKPADVAGPKTKKLIRDLVKRRAEIAAENKRAAEEARRRKEEEARRELEAHAAEIETGEEAREAELVPIAGSSSNPPEPARA